MAQYSPLPGYPAVVRDLSLVVDRAVSWAELEAVVRESAGPLLRGSEYLDTYPLSDEKQSVHFAMTFRRDDRTLTGEEVDEAVKGVVDAVAKTLGATLRA